MEMRQRMLLGFIAAMLLCGCADEGLTADDKTFNMQGSVSDQDADNEDHLSDDGIEDAGTARAAGEREYYWPTTHKFNVGSMKVGEESDHIEIMASPGDPLYAVCDGVISEMGKEEKWGEYIVLDAGDGITFKYGNVTSPLISEGDMIEGGCVIARVASGKNISANRFPVGAYDQGVAFDPVSITDNWIYEEYDDLMLMHESFYTRVWNYDGCEKVGIRIDPGGIRYDGQGRVIIVVMKVDDRIFSEDEINSPEFKQMEDDLAQKLNEYLEDVLTNVVEGRIDKNKYRTELEIRYESWMRDSIIERYYTND